MKEQERKEGDQPTTPPDTTMTCGGVAKPSAPKGELGEYNCVSGSWVWSPFIGD